MRLGDTLHYRDNGLTGIDKGDVGGRCVAARLESRPGEKVEISTAAHGIFTPGEQAATGPNTWHLPADCPNNFGADAPAIAAQPAFASAARKALAPAKPSAAVLTAPSVSRWRIVGIAAAVLLALAVIVAMVLR